MGNYIFSTPRAAAGAAIDDANNEPSSHDFGRDILPSLVGPRARCTPTTSRPTISRATRRKSSRTGATSGPSTPTYEANMDLRAVEPALNLYNRQWPLQHRRLLRPAGQVRLRRGGPARPGHRLDRLGRHASSPAAWSATPCSAAMCTSTPAPRSRDSIIFDDCDIGRRAASAAPSSTRTSTCQRTRLSATTWRRTAAITTSPRAASSSSKGAARRWRSRTLLV